MATRSSSQGPDGASPPIAALFLVVFDRKVGYSIAWKRAIPGVELDGVVEYKSLPSGLHNVQSDLVYFVHERYAGISAFANHPADEAERNAHFATVGVLVPLTYGRLGRSWLHAERLRELAETVVSNVDDTDALQEYWHQNCITSSDTEGLPGESTSPNPGQSSQSTRHKHRTTSDAPGFGPENPSLSRYHPAMSLGKDLETFGPLIFALYRAALLKKRILIMTAAPVQSACNFVYNLSVLSSIPPSAADNAHKSTSLQPIRPLFNVGIHDIANLSQPSSASNPQDAWIACSTDDILGTKTNLYDVLVELPPHGSAESGAKQWPKIKTPDGQAVKATQRDLRRYYMLKRELNKMQRLRQAYHDDNNEEAIDDDTSETAPLTQTKQSEHNEQDEYVQLEGEATLAEPSSWASIVYSSFLWWASAGERDALLEDEAFQDSRLLDNLPLPQESNGSRPGSRSGGKRPSTNGESAGPDEESQAVAVLVIAYAQRLTTLMMETLAEIVEATDTEGDEGEGHKPIAIQSEDLRRMGLDDWSQSDGNFLKEMAALYFGREANVQKQDVELCGIKIC